ncbi:TPA: EAL domain-containing protein [Escherichia coli]|uniref:EAL domain-containing protein n=1 Tax=Escherichia coli TaxID=562 RepID=UPI000BE79207|nr:EAL domain-containing protein [Escherichia coli]HAN7668677.1 EAL domain-containing protein [Escherichia coli]HCL9442068.1 EAL domain-containing protein [Escherichia coli]
MNYKLEPIVDLTESIIGYEILTEADSFSSFKSLKKCEKMKILKEQIKIAENISNTNNNILISINLDSSTIFDVSEDEKCLSRLKKTPNIRLEINEDIKIKPIEFQKLMKCFDGIFLWLDDFDDKQEWRLINLKNIEAIKIDKYFLWGNEATTRFSNLVKTINIAGKKIICEGVNTSLRVDYLKSFNIWGMQGYLYPKTNIRLSSQ